MKILITGGSGFVGSNLAMKLSQNKGFSIIVFDNLKRRGAELNLNHFQELGINFIHGDIRCKDDLESIGDIDLIIDASAEPSVLAGINGGHRQLININLIGTINLMDLALKNNAKFIFLSTSRVFPIKSLNKIKFKELETRYTILEQQDMIGLSNKGISETFSKEGPKSLYGASKYAIEVLIQEYVEFLGLNSIINRCGVIAGPGQLGKVDQGVASLWVARHYWKKPLSYFGYGGTGKQVRDMLHIDDLVDLIVIQINEFDKCRSQTFNVGGGMKSSASLLELTQICENITDNKLNITPVNKDRIADIRIYISDNEKINRLLDWEPKKNVEKIVTDIYTWIKQNENNLEQILA